MQRMGNPPFNGKLGSRQRLPQDLAPKDLGAADVATVATENVFLDTFEFEETNQIGKYGIH